MSEERGEMMREIAVGRSIIARSPSLAGLKRAITIFDAIDDLPDVLPNTTMWRHEEDGEGTDEPGSP